jgi:TetR/AcrR family transcriptional regulator, lmrAB and yxaGH operons repressor
VSRAPAHRDNLVTTAMRLFRRQGYAATGLQQILAESGAPKGSLYHYFPGGKEALGEAAVELAGRLVAKMLTDLAARHAGHPAAFLDAYCRTMADWMEESDFRSGCPIATTMLETAPESHAMTQIGNKVLDSWIEIIARVLSATQTKRDAARQAHLIVAAIEGALILARIRQSAEPILDIPKSLGAIAGGNSTSRSGRSRRDANSS